MTTTKNGEPTSCYKCGGTEFKTDIKAIDGGVLSEYIVECAVCGEALGYYAYGAWDPNYFRELK